MPGFSIYIDKCLENLHLELKIRGFSPKTVRAYLYYNRKLLEFARKEPRAISAGDIKLFMASLKERGVSNITVNLALNALKFYYAGMFKRNFFVHIKRPRKEKTLPVVLSKEEVKKLIEAIENSKHRLIIKFIYSTGVRVSEVVKLQIKDLDLDRRLCYIRQSKGKKDRVVVIAETLVDELKDFIQTKIAQDYLFSSQAGGPLTVRTVQKILKNATHKAGIKKDFGVHSLRHSFATHMLESGINIRYIQALLGHKRLETTQIYTKASNHNLTQLRNPLDNL